MIKRVKRAFTLYKNLKYNATSWWVKMVQGGEHVILYDKEAYHFNKLKMFIREIKVSWQLAYWYLLNNDGLYEILKEEKGCFILHKINYL